MALPIKTWVKALEKDISRAKKKAAEGEQKFLGMKKDYDDASIKVECLRGCLKQTDKAYFIERSRLIVEHNKFANVMGEATWSATMKVAHCRDELHLAQEKFTELEYTIASTKAIEEARWGSTARISWL